MIDEGVASVLRGHEKSLLPVGCTHVEGNFKRGDVILIQSPQGEELARGV